MGEREEAKKRVKGSTRQNINLYVNRTKAGGLEAALVVILVGGGHKASRGGLPYELRICANKELKPVVAVNAGCQAQWQDYMGQKE